MNQYAYQAGKSTDTALHKLVHTIENSLENKEIALGAFLEIEGAFDNTSFNSIIKAAKEKGLNPWRYEYKWRKGDDLKRRSIKNHPAMRFLLVSDSMGSLSAIANPYFSCPIISQIYSAWCDLKTVGKYIKLMWCPSHCGIRGNEAVDQAAKDPLSIVPRDREEDIVNEAIRNLSTPLKLCTPHDFKPWIAKLCRTQWQRSWDNILINKLKRSSPSSWSGHPVKGATGWRRWCSRDSGLATLD
ncbi:hypothetical protein M8J77_001575 [Diaphorina citri]|nr:hypothetical protein M8J77_001575 [Diaphorina citri]